MQALLALLVLAIIVVLWWRVRSGRRAGQARGGNRAPGRLIHDPGADGHPADGIDDPRLAATGVVVAVATMDGPISLAEIDRLKRTAQETFGVSEREALETVSHARWVAGQCASNAEAVRRLSRVVLKTAGTEAGPDLIRMIEEVATAGGAELGPEERDAIAAVRRTMGMEATGPGLG